MIDAEYARWLDDHGQRKAELQGALQAHLPDGDLQAIVDDTLTHHDELFRLKASAAKSDVFHVITGAWTTPAERCFLWMGGFRPSDLVKVWIRLIICVEHLLMSSCLHYTSSIRCLI
jgi:transcription factor TGA